MPSLMASFTSPKLANTLSFVAAPNFQHFNIYLLVIGVTISFFNQYDFRFLFQYSIIVNFSVQVLQSHIWIQSHVWMKMNIQHMWTLNYTNTKEWANIQPTSEQLLGKKPEDKKCLLSYGHPINPPNNHIYSYNIKLFHHHLGRLFYQEWWFCLFLGSHKYKIRGFGPKYILPVFRTVYCCSTQKCSLRQNTSKVLYFNY